MVEEYKSKSRNNVGWIFEDVLYFGWPNQPSSREMRFLHCDTFLCSTFSKYRKSVVLNGSVSKKK